MSLTGYKCWLDSALSSFPTFRVLVSPKHSRILLHFFWLFGYCFSPGEQDPWNKRNNIGTLPKSAYSVNPFALLLIFSCFTELVSVKCWCLMHACLWNNDRINIFSSLWIKGLHNEKCLSVEAGTLLTNHCWTSSASLFFFTW